MSLYVKLKNKNQTVFLWASPKDSFLEARQKLASIIQSDVENIKLVSADKERLLKDDATFEAEKLGADATLYWLNRLPDGIKFEDIDSITESKGVQCEDNVED
mmetsp:Transcript_147/g.187  ORF Transcript_147/g.187 Transcript_147/m.187 type:complete len:103 (+) Transcript_147:312-620(+)